MADGSTSGPIRLVIGFGNDLRSDDGVGRVVARRLEGVPGLTAVEAFQLLPEHVEAAAAADAVVLVDASLDQPAGVVGWAPLEEQAAGTSSYDLHEFRPEGLLGAVRELYGRRPQGWLVTVGVARVELGEGLSGEVAAAVEEACATVVRLLGLPAVG